MFRYFLDSSAVVKRYATEPGTAWIQGLTDPAAGNRIYLVRLTAVEVVSALVRKTPPLSPPILAAAIANFRQDYSMQYQRLVVSDNVIHLAMGFAQTHQLRGADAVQLASAVELTAAITSTGLPAPTFISADTSLNAAARAEGLTVDDPNLHP